MPESYPLTSNRTMKKTIAAFAIAFPLTGLFVACDDDLSPIGNSLNRGEVTISIDTITLDLNAGSHYAAEFDSRAATNLLGRLSTPEYGELKCSYVTRLLPTPALGIPSSISESQIDSMKIVITVPRGSLTGDSLAPQQVKVYRLNRQLPSDIDNTFDPEGYYNPSDLLGVKNYTLSGLSLTNSSFASAKSIQIRMELDRQFALDVVRKYRTEPETFQWPSTFAEWVPGIYVEHSFGRGCVANVTQTKSLIYYHYDTTETVVENGQTVEKPKVAVDSVCNFVTSPAVLSSNNVSYEPGQALKDMVSQGKAVITAPGGYAVHFRFPAEKILERFNSVDNSLAVVSNLVLSIPASTIESNVSIAVPPSLAMIPTAKLEEFFAKQMVPDNKTSFWASYDSASGRYTFSSLRAFISDLAQKGSIDESELEFTLLPVLLGKESVANSDGSTSTIITSCTPYMASPAMTLLDTAKSRFIFTFSRQTLK